MTVAAATIPGQQGGRVLLHDVPWDKYEAFLDLFGDRRLRITYDRGTLEIMSPSSQHERSKELFAVLIRALADAWEMDYASFGSTTCRNALLGRGVEPDACFVVASYDPDKDWARYDPAVDPPPDLAVEIDLSNDSGPRLGVYAAIGIGEVWRFDGHTLKILILRDGAYAEEGRSPTFPLAAPEALAAFVRDFRTGSERSWRREIVRWARTLPANPAG